MAADTNEYNNLLEKRIHSIQEISHKLKDIENQFQQTFHENELKVDYETKSMRIEVRMLSFVFSFFSLDCSP
jgi:hypothetical protein